MINKVKEWRLEVDMLINSMHRFLPSREISLVNTNLQQGKAWLGEALGQLGSVTPYPSSTDPKSKEIEPQADHGFHSLWHFEEGGTMPELDQTQVAHVKAMRDYIKGFIDRLDNFMEANPGMWINEDPKDTQLRWGYQYAIISRINMIHAKHWLGWELNRIYNQQQFDKAVAEETVGATQAPDPLKLY